MIEYLAIIEFENIRSDLAIFKYMHLHLSLVSSHQIYFPKKVYDIHYNEQKSLIVGACQDKIRAYKF
jgi:hypothetical protein